MTEQLLARQWTFYQYFLRRPGSPERQMAVQWLKSVAELFEPGLWDHGKLAGTTPAQFHDSVLASGQYSYDDFNRLSLTNYNGGSYVFNEIYDRYGNRWRQNTIAGTGAQPQLSFDQTTNRVNTAGYAYDAAGNMTNDSFHTYTYDAEGNVVLIDKGQTEKHTYDAFNHRVRVDVPVDANQALEIYFNAFGQRVSMWFPNTGVQYEGNYYWGSTPIAYYSTTGTVFEHQDWMATERMRTTYNGGVEGFYDSLPFGDGITLNIADQDAYHFAGQDYDPWSHTNHATFRQYSYSEGRWLQPDPYDGSYDASNPQSFNRYAYVLNNPLSFIDPSGLDIQCYTTNFYVDGSLDSSEVDCYDIENAPNSDKGKYIPTKRLVLEK